MDKVLLVLLAVLVFGGVVALVLALASLFKGRRGEPVQGLLFVLPALSLVLVGLIWPAVLTIVQSFRGVDGAGEFSFDTYVTTFTRPDLLQTILNTALWVLVAPVLATIIGLAYAVLIDRARIEALAKTLIFLPMAISMVGASIIWKFVYQYKPADSDQIGLLNQVLVMVGAEPVQWLAAAPVNVFAEIVVLIWIQAGFAMTVLSAAIKAVPDETIEAAKIDGATGWRLFANIILPGIRGSVVVVLTTIAIGTLKVFDIVRTMTGGRFDDSVVANEFYNSSFLQGQPGLGSALAVLLFVMVTPIVIYNIVQMRKAV
jgi:alpha-glucoside transport system permease protein